MKKNQRRIMVFASIMLIMFMAACQATPEKVVVVAKGDGLLEEKITEQGEAAMPSDMPEVGTRIQQSFKHPTLNITIDVDALVDVQDGKTMPSVKVVPHKFTQDEVDRVLDYFAGDASLFQIPEDEVWDFLIEPKIADMQKLLEKAREDGDDDMAQRVEANLEIVLQESLEAKDASEFPVITHEICKENLAYGGIYGGEFTEGVYGYFEKDNAAYRFSVGNDESGLHSSMSLSRLRADDKDERLYLDDADFFQSVSVLDEGESLREIPYDEAFCIAQDAAGVFCTDDMALSYAEALQYSEDTLDSYYEFVFTHEVNGVSCKYDQTIIANDEGYSDIWDYEKLIVRVDRYGLKAIRWDYPCEISEQLAQSTAMIPFEDVMNSFSKMVFTKNSYLEDQLDMIVTINEDESTYRTNQNSETIEGALSVGSINICVDKITLGLMRVQSGQDYLLIPVWDFYGYRQMLTPDGIDLDRYLYENSNNSMGGSYIVYHYNVLTVNAIDGSIIDRNLGY